jgi:RNA polymerase sigma factor (sigma-70 family)
VSGWDAAATAQLVEKARDSALPLHEQHAAFTQLIEQSQHVVFGLALTSLRDVDDAEDAAQEAFTIAWLRLRQVRDAAAFPAWLRTIVATQCIRRRRRRTRGSVPVERPLSVDADSRRVDYQALVASALATLPEGERDVVVLFYFLGYTQPVIARLLRLKEGTVGKRLHSARVRIRRSLPPSVRGDFVRLAPSRTFVEKVRLGLFDEYVGQYHFERRPELVVSIAREGDVLVSQAGSQRNVLMSAADQSLLTTHYDGEGRFHRDRHGAITHFVYYEFGRRLGIARKAVSSAAHRGLRTV